MSYKVITLKEVVNLLSVSQTTASKKINLCRDALGKKKHQMLSLEEFKQYFDIKDK